MSDLDQFPDVPVRDKNPVEAERKHAIAINRLRSNLAYAEDWIAILGTIAVEHGVLSMQTDISAANDVPITDWDAGGAVSSQFSTMVVSATDGTITANEPGLYQVDVNTVGVPTGGNNVEYFVAYQKLSGTWGASLPVGTAFQTSQTGAVSMGGWDFVQLAAGEAVRFVIAATTATTLIYDTDFIVAELKLVLPEAEQQAWGAKNVPLANASLHFRGDT